MKFNKKFIEPSTNIEFLSSDNNEYIIDPHHYSKTWQGTVESLIKSAGNRELKILELLSNEEIYTVNEINEKLSSKFSLAPTLSSLHRNNFIHKISKPEFLSIDNDKNIYFKRVFYIISDLGKAVLSARKLTFN